MRRTCSTRCLPEQGRFTPTWRLGVVDVEPPDVAKHVAAIHPHGSVVDRAVFNVRVDLRETAWRGRAAIGRGDLVDDVAGDGIKHIQVAQAITGQARTAHIVVARCHQHHPTAFRVAAGNDLGDDRLAKRQPQMAISTRGGRTTVVAGGAEFELPHRFRCRRIRDVERVVALAAGVQTTDQESFPGAGIVHVACNRGSIHIKLVHVAIVVVRQLVQVGQYRARNHGPGLLASVGINDRGAAGVQRMQHAIVRGHIDHGRAVDVGDLEGLVAGILVRGTRPLDVHRLAAHHIAQHVVTQAEQPASSTRFEVFRPALPAQVVHELVANRLGALVHSAQRAIGHAGVLAQLRHIGGAEIGHFRGIEASVGCPGGQARAVTRERVRAEIHHVVGGTSAHQVDVARIASSIGLCV